MAEYFAYVEDGYPVPSEITKTHRASWETIAGGTRHWSSAQRLDIARQVRAARQQRQELPFNRSYPDSLLSTTALEATRTIAADAAKITRAWASKQTLELGFAPYVELVSIVVTLTAIDGFAEALGRPLESLPAVSSEMPASAEDEDVTDIGAYVPMQDPWHGPNVSRALSMVASANALFMSNVAVMYTGKDHDFGEMIWDGPLSRPQVELLAARVSSINECFY